MNCTSVFGEFARGIVNKKKMLYTKCCVIFYVGRKSNYQCYSLSTVITYVCNDICLIC